MIKKCTCKSEYQDKKYGIDKRVHNPAGKDKNKSDWRCTVCGQKN